MTDFYLNSLFETIEQVEKAALCLTAGDRHEMFAIDAFKESLAVLSSRAKHLDNVAHKKYIDHRS